MEANAEEPQTRPSGESDNATLVTPFMASSAITDRNKLYPVSRWAPRSGQTMEYQRFMISLKRLGKAFGLSPQWIYEMPPSTPHFVELRAMPMKLRNGEAGAALAN